VPGDAALAVPCVTVRVTVVVAEVLEGPEVLELELAEPQALKARAAPAASAAVRAGVSRERALMCRR
jgi:hypothetical protein